MYSFPLIPKKVEKQQPIEIIRLKSYYDSPAQYFYSPKFFSFYVLENSYSNLLLTPVEPIIADLRAWNNLPNKTPLPTNSSSFSFL